MKGLVFFIAASAMAQSVWFEPNVGQVKGQTEWVGRSKGAYLYISGGPGNHLGPELPRIRTLRGCL